MTVKGQYCSAIFSLVFEREKGRYKPMFDSGEDNHGCLLQIKDKCRVPK